MLEDFVKYVGMGLSWGRIGEIVHCTVLVNLNQPAVIFVLFWPVRKSKTLEGQLLLAR